MWMETAELLESDTLKELLERHGRFYFLNREEKQEESKGLIVNRPFSFPYFAAALGAYSAARRKDHALAKTVWRELLGALMTPDNQEGFQSRVYAECADGRKLSEIPWIKTNFSAQWCLNVIVALELIRDELPETMEEAGRLVCGAQEAEFRRA